MACLNLATGVALSRGNRKLGKDTLIFNMNPAAECPSAALELCQLNDRNKCYALKAERMYPEVLPYRIRQRVYWETETIGTILSHFDLMLSRLKKPVTYIRFNESGDFKSQADITKLNTLAGYLKEAYGITVCCYTARKDLDFSNVAFIVNGSGFMLHNAFMAVTEVPDNGIECPGSCFQCNLCKTAKRRTIYVRYH